MNVIGLKELIGNYMILFLFAIAILYFICSIVARMQNKTKRIPRKQITHKYVKIDLCDSKIDFTGCTIAKDDMVLIAMPSFGGRAPAVAIERFFP